MIHLGDITKIDGGKIPPVDVITGGSPCQDLSVAGKRAGLDGERSGLFLEQIRIVKEMRDATGADVDIRLAKPRYMVWENVPGAFSSNGGKDFQAVLTEIIRIAQPNAPDVPMPKNAKWGGQGVSMMTWEDGQLLGEYTMLSFGVSPREENESHLSQILQDSAHPKYSLSEKACAGILRRAEKRGKELPKELKDALERQSLKSNKDSSEIPKDYIESVHLEGVNDSENRGGQSVVEKTFALEGNGQRESHKGNGYSETDTMYTLNAVEHHSVLPINTMVGTRETDEKRTTFGIGEPGDPQFTISAAHGHAVFTASQIKDDGTQESNSP